MGVCGEWESKLVRSALVQEARWMVGRGQSGVDYVSDKKDITSSTNRLEPTPAATVVPLLWSWRGKSRLQVR